jgi:arylsulfatase A-like enzyme
MAKITPIRLAFALFAACAATALSAERSAKPNILFILADDLGYRDTGCYGAAKVKTPRIDRLAGQGVRFTDAHSVCGVCNPSRYSILSGTYLWHAKRKNDYSLYFHEGQVTLPSLLKSAGYRTLALGKWHNGFGRQPEPDWNGELNPGPLEIGFDHFFGTPRTHNEPPLVFVEDHRVVALDAADRIRVDKSPGTGAHGTMQGGAKAKAARPDERIDFIMAEKAAAFFAGQQRETPFFLYLAFAAPHVPINPDPAFRGKSQAGLYGDYVQQLDHCVGLVLDALEKQGLADQTLVLFTSDNGGVYHADALTEGHRTNGELLGQKTDAWEGGHRVPLLARWPGHIPAGSERRELFTQVDLMATFAEATGILLPEGASPDGLSEWAAFTDPAKAAARRDEAVFQGTGGFALRQGDWLYLPKQGSCGMTTPEQQPKPWGQPWTKLGFINSDVDDRGRIKNDAPAAQLYNLKADPAETVNVIQEHPEIAQKLAARLDVLVPPKKTAPKPPTAPK